MIDDKIRCEISNFSLCLLDRVIDHEDIYLLRQLMKIIRKNNYLEIVFIDLEKIYNVPRDLLLWILEKKGIVTIYINVMKDMYNNLVTNV